MEVTLLPHELTICEWVGKQRQKAAEEGNYDKGEGSGGTAAAHMHGAACEWAAAIALNRYWRPTIGRIKERDVGGLYEVRGTTLEHGHLLIKPKNYKDGHCPFILVINKWPRFRLIGWYHSADAERLIPIEHRLGTDIAHWVKQSMLRDLNELP